MSNKLDVDGTTFTPNQIRRLESALAREHAEVERLKKQYADHLELDADEDKVFEEKYQMRVSERNYWMGMYTQLCDDVLKVFVEFNFATPARTYREQPGLLISDLRRNLENLRAAAITEYSLRVRAERALTQPSTED